MIPSWGSALLRRVLCPSPRSLADHEIQFDETDQVAMCGVSDDTEGLDAPPGCHGAGFQRMRQDLSLPFVQLRLHRGCHQKPLLRRPQALDVLARPRESNLEITRVGAEDRLIESVAAHLVAHPSKAASALLDPVEVGKTLGQDRIT